MTHKCKCGWTGKAAGLTDIFPGGPKEYCPNCRANGYALRPYLIDEEPDTTQLRTLTAEECEEPLPDPPTVYQLNVGMRCRVRSPGLIGRLGTIVTIDISSPAHEEIHVRFDGDEIPIAPFRPREIHIIPQ